MNTFNDNTMTSSIQYPARLKLLAAIICIVTLFIPVITFGQSRSTNDIKSNVQELNRKQISLEPNDPWTIDHIITPEELSKELSNSKTKKPVIFHVGFDFLYKQGHIPGSIYAGPASNQQGIDILKDKVLKFKHDRDIVLYCGCCPWKYCPNIRQAYITFIELGFTNVKVLYIADTFEKDWKDKGYSVVK
jgi:rhodanese-related sulfurtransferase